MRAIVFGSADEIGEGGSVLIERSDEVTEGLVIAGGDEYAAAILLDKIGGVIGFIANDRRGRHEGLNEATGAFRNDVREEHEMGTFNAIENFITVGKKARKRYAVLEIELLG